MLTGRADVNLLAARAPVMTSFAAEPLHLEEAEILQAAFEQPYALRETSLPPGLYATSPPLLVLLVWQVARSPWGPFALAQARVSGRSGARPRGFVVGCVIDNPEAAAALASDWGLPAVPGSVELLRGYDRAELAVQADGRTAVRMVGLDPDPLSVDDVQFSVTTTLATTPRGVRLVQLEPEYELRRVERLRPRLDSFDARAWGGPPLEPGYPVAATISVGDITIPPIRYVSRPDVSAFQGTEQL
jgi:hypothetical protein